MTKGHNPRTATNDYFNFFNIKIPRKWFLYCIITIGILIIIFICSYLLFANNNNSSNEQRSVDHNVNNKGEILPFIQEKQNGDDDNILLYSNKYFTEPTLKNDDILPESTLFKNKNQVISQNTNDNWIRKELFNNTEKFNERLRFILNCVDSNYRSEMLLNGNFWILKNYIRAEHGALACHESITYCTHGDLTYLKHLIPLIRRWRAPISVALHAPGTDFHNTITAIQYLRECLQESIAVREFVTFHIYFSAKHIPHNIPKAEELNKVNCALYLSHPPFHNITKSQLYTTNKNLLYPINVGRNIARSAALTYFILSSDIEFLPSRNLVPKFLQMIVSNGVDFQKNTPRVFTLPLFRIDDSILLNKVKTKNQLLTLIPTNVSPLNNDQLEPQINEWIKEPVDNLKFGVFYTATRTAEFKNWNPIYIGTHNDPYYDERLRLEGKNDRSTQSYALCLLNYEFLILNNAFLIANFNETIISRETDAYQMKLEGITNQLILNINSEMRNIYGSRDECDI